MASILRAAPPPVLDPCASTWYRLQVYPAKVAVELLANHMQRVLGRWHLVLPICIGKGKGNCDRLLLPPRRIASAPSGVFPQLAHATPVPSTLDSAQSGRACLSSCSNLGLPAPYVAPSSSSHPSSVTGSPQHSSSPPQPQPVPGNPSRYSQQFPWPRPCRIGRPREGGCHAGPGL